MTTDNLYREVILQELATPKNYGFLSHPTHQFSQENLSCGDSISVQLELSSALDDAKNQNETFSNSQLTNQEDLKVIKKVAWQGAGCAVSQATMSLLSEFVMHKTVSEVQKISNNDLLSLLGVTKINLGREKCLRLGLIAIQKAVKSKGKV
jgi:nitrogen fixation protein NifU and related proteins